VNEHAEQCSPAPEGAGTPGTGAAPGNTDTEAQGATVFVVRDQRGCYWGKGREWVDGREPRQVARFRHRDEAVNTLFELSSKDVALRGSVIEAEPGPRGEPALAPGCLYPDSGERHSPGSEVEEEDGPAPTPTPQESDAQT
jgi:hypothetical protein